MDEDDEASRCKHEGCISWLKPFNYAFKERRPYMFCRKCNTWIEVNFK